MSRTEPPGGANGVSPIFVLDALMPGDMAKKAEAIGVAKAHMDGLRMFALAVLAGAFIALGAVFSNTVTAGAAGQMPLGLIKLLGGLVFCLGLILVVVGGAELFTGNNLIVMAWAGRHVSTPRLLRNWIIVYFGNLVGSLGTAILVFLSGHYAMGGGAVGKGMLAVAEYKCGLEFIPALCLGVLCNALVCLAVWLCYSARTVIDKIAAIVFPITAFVAAGFEHSVANMYFIGMGLIMKNQAPGGFWEAIGSGPGAYPHLTVQAFLVDNLLPVTLGNILGGTLLVGLVYWLVYLRAQKA